MTQGIKFIETYEHDDYCSQLYDAVSEYESQGYTVEIKPQVEIEADHDELKVRCAICIWMSISAGWLRIWRTRI